MIGLGALAFASPWVLVSLAGLPAIWWLLRVTPPAPRRLVFPAIRLLLGLRPREETPARTPLWLLLLRIAIAALVILGLAHPVLNPPARLAGSGPLVLVVDDGWASARDWDRRQRTIASLIDQAEREDRLVALVPTAPLPGGEARPPAQAVRAADARTAAQALEPRPWRSDRRAALARLEALPISGSANVVWIADGLADDGGFEQAFAERLQRLGSLLVVTGEPQRLADLLTPADRPDAAELAVRVQRPAGLGPRGFDLRVLGDDTRLLARQSIELAPGTRSEVVRIALPGELRNRAARIEIEGEPSAGAVLLLDERWRRRPVGILSARRVPGSEGQPLLSESYYLERALQPFSEVRQGTVGELLRRETAVIAIGDGAPILQRGEREALQRWMEETGGVVLRFAGPALAETGGDEFLPVRLRGGGRTIGGALSWERPARLAPFREDGPFAGLVIPEDVTVGRQVLAEPALDLAEKTWARLTDGTPLVTAERRGRGALVLVHTSASPDWSNLALSGLFVDMLRRVTALSEGVAAQAAEATLPPLETLDGRGRLGPPPSGVKPIAGAFVAAAADPSHPPGYYGPSDGRRALNLASAMKEVTMIGDLPAGARRETFERGAEVDLKPPLLVAAFLLGLADLTIAYALRGLLPMPRRRGAAAAAVLLALGLLGAWPGTAAAQTPGAASDDGFAAAATTDLRLAYVRTGLPEVDDVSRAGLSGLTQILRRRTSIEAAEPLEVDPETDELIFFPLLYWPVVTGQPALTARGAERVNRFLATGGTVVFDTRGASERGGGNAAERLRRVAAGVRMPTLIPVPPDHVLTKAFYLLQEFPGRWGGGTLWVEPADDRVNDGVATVIVGGADWAGAWAAEPDGRPRHAIVPGGEPQREQAYRFGVNLVMYALTGNYKSDQVHVPAILERLGQ